MQLTAIISKLRAALAVPIESEEQLLSALVKTRQALECEPDAAGLSALRFHCNWMVHSYLSRGTAFDLIGHVDHYQHLLDDILEDNPVTLNAADFRTLAELDDLMYFRRFRSELHIFLKRHQLPESAIDDDRWPEFLKFYILAVQSSPLKYEPQQQKKHAPPPVPPAVQEVTVSLVDYKPAGTGEFRLMFVWDWPNGNDNSPIGVRRVLML
jgi:hypothetical protein